MDRIKTTPAALRAKANQIGESGANIKVTTGKMFTIVESITGNVWTGDAQLAYTNQFAELEDDAERMHQMTIDLETALTNIAAEYEAVEIDMQSFSQSLATEVVG
ncbi:MAG: WXG100 family type VII secretion target [Lachnospiraceae bacterium]|nr:WXG100 family type VII secretion target [Lachnospiraceae bacterium]